MNGAPDSGDLTDPAAFHPGAHLIVKMTPTLGAPEIDVTNAIIGDTGDVRDPSFSDDGTKLLFSLHMEDNNVDPPETWNIYEYDLTQPLGANNPHRVMPVQSNPENGDDIEPIYLPGGRILFSSTRAARVTGIEIDEAVDTAGSSFPPTIEAQNSNNHAFNLHSMASDGSDIRQLSFNMSNDLYPTLIRYLPGLEGRVLFSRWEHSPGRNQMSLYTVKPDGTDVQYLYGAHSHNTGTNNGTIQFIQPRETGGGDVMALAMPFTGTFGGGDPTLINVNQYSDNVVPVNASSGLTGPAQSSTSQGTVVTNAGFSPAGRFSSVVPLLDGTNRAMVSYTLCYANVLDTATNTTQTLPCNDSRVDLSNTATTTEAPPRYGIFIYDQGNNTVLPITPPVANSYLTDIAIVQDKVPATNLQYTVDESPTAEQMGTLDIRSVYDLDGAFDSSLLSFPSTAVQNAFNALCASVPDQTACGRLKLQYIANPVNATGDPASNPTLIVRKPQFLRIVKGVYLPDDTVRDFKTSAFGINRSQLMRQIVGYTPIDPDGSVHVKVPANVPLSISVVDKNGRRVGNRHGFWLTIRQGATMSCNGCHNPNSTAPHGRVAGEFPTLNTGAATDGAVFPGTNPANPYVVNAGDSMAYLRSNGPVGSSGLDPIKPTVNMIFQDVWTDPGLTGRPLDAAYSYTYAALSTHSPANSACGTWKETCRVTINYEADIQPLWSLTRTAADGATDVTCINCHNAAGAGLTPPTQLDLTNSTSDINADYFTSYEELLNQDNQVNAAGADVLSDPNDPNSTITVNPPMSAGSAANSSAFFAKFASPFPGPTQHCTDNGMGTCVPWLSESELKLLSEWLDVGAQYYNNPFLAPLN
ncbi:MAG: hypothetical protein GC149_04145 [Gammaproteobacteria bacterium]|nr:hypothetical protein [Gammaproteobacteria bacterium]